MCIWERTLFIYSSTTFLYASHKNSTVIMNGELQKIWQKTVRAPLRKKNCWISTPSTLILSFKLLRIWILLQIQTSLNMTTRTLVYCPCTLWTVQTRNNAEQATLKCRYLYSNLHGAVPHKNLNIHQLRYETLGTCVYSSLRPFWLGFLTNSLLIYRKLLKFEDVTLNTLRCQKVFFEPVNFSRQYANY